MTRSTITWFVAVTLYASPPQQDLKPSRNGHTICHKAVSKPVHLAEMCTTEREGQRSMWRDPSGGGGEGRLTAWQNCAVHWAWHSKAGMLSNSQRKEKEKERKGEFSRRGEGEKRRGGMKAGGICASLWETALVLIYTSMARAQNELWEQNNNRNQEII